MRRLVGIVVVSLLFTVARANASDCEASVRREFARGHQAERAGDDTRARMHYLAAYEMLPNGPIATNLGLVETRLEMWAAAADHLTAALEQELTEEARREVEQVREEVLTHVGTVDVEVSPGSATVTINGTVVAEDKERVVVYLEPGTYSIRAADNGFFPESLSVDVGAGEHTTAHFLLERNEGLPFPTKPPSTADPDLTEKPSGLAPLVVIGSTLTVVALGLGAGFSVTAESDAREDIAVASFGSGAGLAVGTLLTWVAVRGSRKQRSGSGTLTDRSASAPPAHNGGFATIIF